MSKHQTSSDSLLYAVSSLRGQMRLWGTNLENGSRQGITNVVSFGFYRNKDKLSIYTVASTDVDKIDSKTYIPPFKPEKKMFRYGIKWTKLRLEYYADRQLIRVVNTSDLSNFVGPLHIDFTGFTENLSWLQDYQYEKKSDLLVQSVKYTPGERCSMI